MTTLWSNGDIDAAIQQAYLDILESEDWTFLNAEETIATVIGTAEYALPTLKTVQGVAVLTGGKRGDLRSRSLASMDERHFEDYASNGFPQEYTFNDDRSGIIVHPTPDAVYTLNVRGRALVPSLSGNDANVPIFDAEFHHVISLAAAIDVLEQEGDDSERSQNYLARADTILGRMFDRYQLDHDESKIQMGGRRDRHRARRFYVEGQPNYPWLS